jgi:hypothetical protein
MTEVVRHEVPDRIRLKNKIRNINKNMFIPTQGKKEVYLI